MIPIEVSRGYHSTCGIHQTRKRSPGPCRYCAAALHYELDQHIDTEHVADKVRRLIREGRTRTEVAEIVELPRWKVNVYANRETADLSTTKQRRREATEALLAQGRGPLAYDKFIRDKRNAYRRADEEMRRAALQK